jgi:pimeloyl-ACP methyl ester carboxylesterase
MFNRVYESQQKYKRTFTRVGAHTIHAAEGGSGSPLLLLHGLAGSCRWWGHNLDGLGRHFRVYAPDIPGFGLSRSRQRFNLHGVADELARWMDQLGLRQAHVVGHSMGGYVAIDMAARYPELVDRLVLVSAAVRAGDVHQPHASPSSRCRKPSMRGLSALPLLLSDLCRCSPQSIFAATEGLMRTRVEDRLRRIQAPTMVLWGDRDAMVPITQGYALASQLPCDELVVIEQAGHHPMWDQPETFNAELTAFLHQPRRRIPLPPARMAA